MSRSRPLRAVKVCRVCGEGFDAFKALDARGPYCSPACLSEARRRQREAPVVGAPEAPVGPAALPPTITLGNRNAVVSLGPDLDL